MTFVESKVDDLMISDYSRDGLLIAASYSFDEEYIYPEDWE